MTNIEIRMSKQMSNDEIRMSNAGSAAASSGHSTFVLRHCFVIRISSSIRHSAFLFRVWRQSCPRRTIHAPEFIAFPEKCRVEASDELLVARIRKGDTAALAEFIQARRLQLLAYIGRNL